MLVGNCSLSLYPRRPKHAGRHLRPLRLHRGRAPSPLRRLRAVDVEQLRRLPRHGQRHGHRHQPRRARGPQPDPPRGHGRRRLDPCRDPRRDRRRWPRCSTTRCRPARGGSRRRSSTSTRTAGRCPRGRPTAPSSTRCSTSSSGPAAGSSSSSPGCSATTPRSPSEDLARRCGRRGIPLTWTGFVHSDSNPALTQRWLDMAQPARRRRRAHLPAALAADRRLPAQLGLVDDVHVDAGGLAQGGRRPRRRQGRAPRAIPSGGPRARAEWDRTEKAMFPHRRLETRALRRGGRRRERAMAGAHARRARRRAGRPPVRRLRRLRAGQRLPSRRRRGRHLQRRRRRRRPHARRSRRAHQLLGRRRAHADAVRLGRHHAAAHPARARAGRLHARAGRPRADGRQAEVFGFHGRGVRRRGQRSPTSPCSRSTSSTTTATSSCTTSRSGGARLRRPEGGYRATIVDGVPVQLDGTLTGALPGRVISSAG